MALLGDLTLALGRVVTSKVAGTAKAILGNLASLDKDEDDAEAETSSDEPLYGTLGFYFRPEPPVSVEDATGNNPEGAAEFVGMRVGGRIYPYGYRDLRLNAKLNPDEGEVGLVQYRGGFISMKTNDSATGTNIMLYAVDNTSGGDPDKAHAISMETEPTNSHISLMHGEGQSITLTKEAKIIIANAPGDAFLEVNANGLVLNGNTAIKGALLGIDVGNPVSSEGLMMSADLLTWITQANVLFAALVAAIGNPIPTIVAPTATPKASTIAKASETAV